MNAFFLHYTPPCTSAAPPPPPPCASCIVAVHSLSPYLPPIPTESWFLGRVGEFLRFRLLPDQHTDQHTSLPGWIHGGMVLHDLHLTYLFPADVTTLSRIDWVQSGTLNIRTLRYTFCWVDACKRTQLYQSTKSRTSTIQHCVWGLLHAIGT